MDPSQRRHVEFAKYHLAHRDPKYDMKHWRQSIVTDWLAALHTTGASSVLDVGCGKAETRQLAHNVGLSWHGCDVVDYLCEGPDIDLLPQGAAELPYDDDQFDLVTCNDVMEHVPVEDVGFVLGELRRVARVAVLLGISRKHDNKPEAEKLHITIKTEDWWLASVFECMDGKATKVFADRIPEIKQPYLWVSVQ